MEQDATQSVLGYIIAWLPLAVFLVIWIWGLVTLKQYVRARELAGHDNATAIRELVETNREIVAVLRDLKSDLQVRRS
ncbi:hypothetical protein EN836_28455 [Mesorhizobium sp. M1C.F.Ca.ET.193.01.1.1]|uniref:hypothetical protein n=1 Tax=unclassified Mesorhizobium TaxID=325217 RepID=UPI000FD2B409|nr:MULTISPECIES: hypothetical protein [unclassified Mesorhizobium]TGS93019.1 hypothetical protein EN820_49115 [bacterium M00.F.Ca.ET.177.01.1.1]TGQ50542.1 hypothetical protein EN853_28445 [Mesorhizobium sp. M1C.F.Ca.ET.210.01.1.1]TGQ65717.1 hypothetical protein EN855_028460 [Mesorhizobium sp. M1C.F.Ca.ET.212.01.1.1]TGQ99447.1 hypothetical protein EN847_28445 [Mesorhizobium sp. M1C.F.Ca.ET.204.01.1.1]TGR19852.1 hypothetical protein EN839_28445 [Mesorhizobium sp. M1C.F.Ca.ET.196.01.1.1]